jgi:hypothetical protein
VTLPEHGGTVHERTVDLAYEWARRAVLEIARKTCRRATPQSAFGTEPDLHIAASDMDAVARIQAAAGLGLAARQLAIGYSRRARGVGFSWREIGAALGSECLTRPAASAADSAFDYVADTAELGRLVFTWVCRACRRTITDHGPSHQADREDGHADTCPRLVTAASENGDPR